MTASLLYRIAAVLLVLYAAGHTMGFRRVDPRWGVDAFIAGLRTKQFAVQGVQRTYWGFYIGFGLFVTVLLLFAAALAWQLGALPPAVRAAMPIATWGFALCFVAATIVTWRYFFTAPIVFSAVITICLILAAWRSGVVS
jgi:hypothetical protein